MNWSKLDYSKSQVRKAGELLKKDILDLDFEVSFDEIPKAHRVLSNWRAAHAYPMHNFVKSLKNKACKIDANATVVQRLKRTPSIIAKLRREHIELDRMEDIAGCRVVLDNLAQVYDLRKEIVKARSVYALKRERDYLMEAKASGYRGIHLIFTYRGGKGEYRGLHTELQLRSKIQHSWATAVEVVGTFSKENLKASEGNQSWLDFFKLVSEGFACLEENRPFSQREALKALSLEMSFENRIQALTRLADIIGLENKADYYLLILDIANLKLKGIRADEEQWDAIVAKYEQYENEYKRDPNVDVVLVSADSIEELRMGYPNYFVDTRVFMRNLSMILENNDAN